MDLSFWVKVFFVISTLCFVLSMYLIIDSCSIKKKVNRILKNKKLEK
jgi:hypothetical protein